MQFRANRAISSNCFPSLIFFMIFPLLMTSFISSSPKSLLHILAILNESFAVIALISSSLQCFSRKMPLQTLKSINDSRQRICTTKILQISNVRNIFFIIDECFYLIYCSRIPAMSGYDNFCFTKYDVFSIILTRENQIPDFPKSSYPITPLKEYPTIKFRDDCFSC